MLNHTIDNAPRVSGERLWSRLMAMAQIGATAAWRLQSSGADGRRLRGPRALCALGEGGGLHGPRGRHRQPVRRGDAGRDDALPVVMTGSHLDTQPTGGKFDGVYGVLAGLEVIESLNDRAISTRHPIEVAVWCNEEGCRFPAAMMGSAVWSGRMPLEKRLRAQGSRRPERARGARARAA